MENNNPLVSVIIACYNAEQYIDLCFEGLLNQTYQNFEIIVCDDASTDSSLKKLNEWETKDGRIKVLHNEKNMFAPYTRNRCLEISQGEFCMIHDIDDTSTPDRIEKQVKVLQNEPDLGFVSGSMAAFVENPGETFTVLKNKKEYPTKWDFLWNTPFFHPVSMFTRECIMSVGGYRVAEETRRGQDYDMFMRMYAAGYKGKNIDEPLYNFRMDAANIKRRTFKARIGEYKIRKFGFKAMGLMPWAFPFLFKPFVAHIVQKIRYR